MTGTDSVPMFSKCDLPRINLIWEEKKYLGRQDV